MLELLIIGGVAALLNVGASKAPSGLPPRASSLEQDGEYALPAAVATPVSRTAPRLKIPAAIVNTKRQPNVVKAAPVKAATVLRNTIFNPATVNPKRRGK